MSAKGPIVVAAGGTGGHLFPAQALAAQLIQRGRQVFLMTDPRGHNYAQAFPNAEILTVPSATFAGLGPIGKVGALATLARGAFRAYRLLGRLAPSSVVGFGGYPSLPALVAASQRGLPTLVHEQNAVLGRVNRFLAPRVSLIAASFPGVARVPKAAESKVVVTGNPVRDAILGLTDLAYVPPDPDGPIHVLIFGGSQGARVFSQFLPQALAKLAPALKVRLRVEQQCRPEDLNGVKDAYAAQGISAELNNFFNDMGVRLTRAHLIVARAGASTVTEITALGRPSILVPYPFAMDDHQSANAKLLADRSAAIALAEKGLTAEALAETLTTLCQNPSRLTALAQSAKAMGRLSATRQLADLVEGLGAGEPAAALRAKLETQP